MSNVLGVLTANKQCEPSDVAVPQSSSQEISDRVLDLTLTELEQAKNILNSEFMYYLVQFNGMMRNGRKLSKVEQNLLDKFIEEYQIQYKSPLAEALKEE